MPISQLLTQQQRTKSVFPVTLHARHARVLTPTNAYPATYLTLIMTASATVHALQTALTHTLLRTLTLKSAYPVMTPTAIDATTTRSSKIAHFANLDIVSMTSDVLRPAPLALSLIDITALVIFPLITDCNPHCATCTSETEC